MSRPFRTRFAPSPTGPLHLGHAYSAILAHDMARAAGGTFLVRIEDIDQTRARPEWEAQIYEDLRWLGLSWEVPVMRQSARMDAYAKPLKQLWDDQLLFACDRKRRDIEAAASAPQEGVAYGPDGIVYSGTCNRPENKAGSLAWPVPDGHALRLDMALATARIAAQDGSPSGLAFREEGAGPNGETGLINVSPSCLRDNVGNVVLSRRDMGTSYHLSVVLDDADQQISHVVRGADLFDATQIHIVLQRLLGLPTPVYHHHRLIRDDAGKRLAKRDDARSIHAFRNDGASPQDMRAMVGL